MKSVRAKLENARKDLLDLSLRNPLINYRVLKAKGLEIVDEKPEQVFRILVLNEKPMSFLPARENTDPSGSDQLSEILAQPMDENEDAAARHRDDRLQTPYTSEHLQRRLLNTFYAARTSIEEQGVTTLFVALGLLHWYESDQSEERRKAPLLLIPADLSRTSVEEKFQIQYDGEDIEPNLSLEAKLHLEFGVELPPLPEAEDLDVQNYFQAIADRIRHLKRWEVEFDAVDLGFFSFSKFLMYKDLDAAKWPEEGKPAQHPLIRAILEEGFREPEPKIGEEDFIDRHLDPAEVHQVVDADSSQTLAILNALQGRNLVIQGPPGTGKSQTITNLIAEAVAARKRVLFVSEKMAALEVVKRRLDSVELGPACLELHSHKTQKKAVLDELRSTLQLGKPAANAGQDFIEVLRLSRNQLNEYAAAVNTPVDGTDTTPYRAVGRLLKLQSRLSEVGWKPLDSRHVRGWSRVDLQTRLVLVENTQALLRKIGLPDRHRFRGSRLRHLLPADKLRIVDATTECEGAAGRLWDRAGTLAALLKVSPPDDVSGVNPLTQCGEHILRRPELNGLTIAGKAWVEHRKVLEELIQCGAALAKARKEFGPILREQAWEEDFSETRDRLHILARRWWRCLSPEFWQIRRKLLDWCTGRYPGRMVALLELVDALTRARECRGKLDSKEALLRGFFEGALQDWAGTDWERLEAVLKWMLELERLREAGGYSAAVYDSIHQLDDSAVKSALSPLGRLLQEHGSGCRELVKLLDLEAQERFPSGSLETEPFQEQLACIRDWRENIDSLQDIVSLNHAADSMRQNGMEFVLPAVYGWEAAGSHLSALVEHCWYSSVLDRAFEERAVLANFDPEAHQTNLERFRKLDSRMLELNRVRLAARHWDGLPKSDGAGQLRVLLREFEKKRRHLPIRQLIEKAGLVIQAIKPVFMMSPLSVAMYISPGSVKFDMVIFDEASQVKPVDAFGALLRASQAIVVGDQRQLPPTSFFDRIIDTEEEEVEDDVADLESILGLFCAQGAPQSMLRWHYRSRHESLIALSNYEFYDNRLVIFPSPDAARESCGVRFHHLPQTAYERGKRINLEEAKRVAAAAMEHARRSPDLTLGIAAFSLSQMHIIQDQLELLRRSDPSCESFFSAHPEEPFFVKNLESVQGDERDVIFISVGYGKTREGYLAHNFGPLNREGGERRLNVLITRARLRCEVFTNMRSADIDLNRSGARGVVALKRYLHFAETGQLDVPAASGREADSEFEEMVAEELHKLGYEAHRQVGSGGFYIDLAVVDPEKPGRYLLGIECDGASYHRSRSARDRDRLRQQVLVKLGWRIHRIWSTDWFRNTQREIRKLAESIEAAKVVQPGPSVDGSPRAQSASEESRTASERPPSISEQARPTSRVVTRIQVEEGAREASPVAEYRLAQVRMPQGVELHLLPAGLLAGLVQEVVAVEAPVHLDEVVRRITEAAGLKRAGGRIRQAVKRAVDFAGRQGRIQVKGEFLWRPDMREVPLRSRAALPPVSRAIQLIAPEEIEAAVLRAVELAHGIGREEAIQEASRYFGYARTTEGIHHEIHRALERMLKRNGLQEQGGILVKPRG